MVADLVRFQREARELLATDDARPVARPLARGAALLARVRRPADRPAGGRRLVRRPAADVELPRALPGRVLRQPRDARAARPPEAGARSRAARTATWRRSSRRGATACGWRRRCRASSGTPTTSRSRRTGRARALRRGRPRHPLRPGARAARRPHRPRARAARRDPVPAQRGGAPHRRAPAPAPPARVGELELPPARRAHRQADGDLPHEPPAVAARRRASSA